MSNTVKGEMTRCGLVALVGAPNVGKSTLLNAMVGEKVGIVSPKPNTTRVVVRGVVAEGSSQVVFVDTPGLNSSKVAFDRQLAQRAQGSLAEADVVALVIDAARGFDERAKEVIGGLQSRATQGDVQKAVLIINKVDKLNPRSKVLEMMTEAQRLNVFEAVFAVAASNGSGVQDIVPGLAKLLPEGPWLFPADMTTDMPLPLRLAELTREKAMRSLHDEVPYGIAVVTDEINDIEAPVVVSQRILVAREAHKGMVIGAGGQMLKRIGSYAREDMQEVMGKGVRLEITVEVREGWAERMEMLRETGILDG